MKHSIRTYPLRIIAIITEICSVVFSCLLYFRPSTNYRFHEIMSALYLGHLLGVFLICPLLLSIYNLLYLCLPHRSELMRIRSQRMELLTIIFGGLCFYMATMLYETQWHTDWWKQIYNTQLHAPVATWTYPTVITLLIIGILGYITLYFARRRPLPPLIIVFGFGGIYIGASICLILLIQLMKHNWVLCVYLGNILLIFLKIIKEFVINYQELSIGTHTKCRWLKKLISKSVRLPLWGLLVSIPILGIAIALLTIFGQEPNSIIQAWTQTSDWTFSQQVAPPSLPLDSHYLCTVAARGHSRLVKPLRLGCRHGHLVLVNRQLAVANAFEELLQERTPKFHKTVRRIYDQYGYPIAKHINSPLLADVIWLIMKPAEWLFTFILYLFDTNPEDRIAVQYPHAPLPGKEVHNID